MEHKDALGDKIEIGRKYGYSINKNGFTHVVTGLVKNFTSSGVTLTVLSAVQALYSDQPLPIEFKENVNVKGINLFPVKDKTERVYDTMVAKLRTEFPDMSIAEIDEAIEYWANRKLKGLQIKEYEGKDELS